MLQNAEKIIALYIDWLNNFLTIKAFADYYELTVEDATRIIDCGRFIANNDLSYWAAKI